MYDVFLSFNSRSREMVLAVDEALRTANRCPEASYFIARAD